VDRTLLNHLLKMFTALGIYSESFEKPFLECTSEFYAAEGTKYMQQSDVTDYLKHVEVHFFPSSLQTIRDVWALCFSKINSIDILNFSKTNKILSIFF